MSKWIDLVGMTNFPGPGLYIFIANCCAFRI